MHGSKAPVLSALADASQGQSLAAAGRLAAAALGAAAGAPLELSTLLELAQPSGHADADGTQQRLQWVATAAALDLLRRHPSIHGAAASMSQLVLPQLAAASLAQQHELLQAAAELVANCGAWDLGLQLVQAAGGSQPPSSGEQSQPPGVAAAAARLPPDVQAQLAAAIVSQALQQGSQQEAGAVLQHAATQMLSLALQQLVGAPPAAPSKAGGQPAAAARAAAQRLLLPAALQAAAALGQAATALQALWGTCK